MNPRARIWMILACTSQPWHGASLLSAHNAPELERCSSPSTPSPEAGSFAWQGAENDPSHWNVRPTQSLLLQPEVRQTTEQLPVLSVRNGVLIYQCPSDKCFHRAPSLPDLPMSHSVTRSVLIPRPAALGVLLRFLRPAGFGFQKIFSATNAKRFPEPSEKDTPSALGSGAHSRHFVQECPE